MPQAEIAIRPFSVTIRCVSSSELAPMETSTSGNRTRPSLVTGGRDCIVSRTVRKSSVTGVFDNPRHAMEAALVRWISCVANRWAPSRRMPVNRSDRIAIDPPTLFPFPEEGNMASPESIRMEQCRVAGESKARSSCFHSVGLTLHRVSQRAGGDAQLDFDGSISGDVPVAVKRDPPRFHQRTGSCLETSHQSSSICTYRNGLLSTTSRTNVRAP